MRIESARRQGDELCLTTKDPEAWRWLYQFKPGDFEIKPKRKKRSLDANAYAWVLLDKIAEAVRLPVLEVYRKELLEIGGASEVVCVQERALPRLNALWTQKGLGWVTEPFPSKVPGCVNVRLHYGSSAFDTKQMSVFIDHLIEEARALGIETRPEAEVKSMLEAWE